MSQLEYGDYYKFTASAGIALLVAAAVLPWAFLREPFDLFHETIKIALLTPEAQDLIHRRQQFVATIVMLVPWISTALGLVGAFLTAFGLIKWRSRQVIRDRGEDLDVQKKDKELLNMSEAEVEQKARDDAASLEEDQPLVALTVSATTSNVYLAVENALLGRLADCYGPRLKRNQRLGTVEFDAIINVKQSERIIVEIKYISKGFRQGWLTESLSNLAARTQLYSSTFSRPTRGILLIVLGPESRPSIQALVDKESTIMRENSSARFRNLRINTLREADISTIKCETLKSIIEGNI